MAKFNMGDVKKIRVELVMDGVTYEVELAQTDSDEATASMNINHESMRRPDPTETYWEQQPTGNATIELTAYGKLVKSERRTE